MFRSFLFRLWFAHDPSYLEIAGVSSSIRINYTSDWSFKRQKLCKLNLMGFVTRDISLFPSNPNLYCNYFIFYYWSTQNYLNHKTIQILHQTFRKERILHLKIQALFLFLIFWYIFLVPSTQVHFIDPHQDLQS